MSNFFHTAPGYFTWTPENNTWLPIVIVHVLSYEGRLAAWEWQGTHCYNCTGGPCCFHMFWDVFELCYPFDNNMYNIVDAITCHQKPHIPTWCSSCHTKSSINSQFSGQIFCKNVIGPFSKYVCSTVLGIWRAYFLLMNIK